MTDKKKKLKKIKVIANIPKDLPTYAVSGFFGGLSKTEGIIKFFEDDLIPIVDENNQLVISEVEKKFLANIKVSPSVWKRMAYWMLKHVGEHEKRHGEIKVKHLVKKGIDVDYEYI